MRSYAAFKLLNFVLEFESSQIVLMNKILQRNINFNKKENCKNL